MQINITLTDEQVDSLFKDDKSSERVIIDTFTSEQKTEVLKYACVEWLKKSLQETNNWRGYKDSSFGVRLKEELITAFKQKSLEDIMEEPEVITLKETTLKYCTDNFTKIVLEEVVKNVVNDILLNQQKVNDICRYTTEILLNKG